MLLLFETAAGFALFKVNKEDKLEQSNVSDSAQPAEPSEHGAAADLSHRLLLLLPQDLAKDFETLDSAKKVRYIMQHVLQVTACSASLQAWQQ